MKTTILAVGRLKAGPEAELITAYVRQLQSTLSIVEIDPNKHRGQAAEQAALVSAIPEGAVVVVLDEKGRDLSSTALAEKIEAWRDQGRRELVFLIGGADGHLEATRKRASLVLSFGKATWPHKLARVMVVEQIYRCHQINAGHPYHRDG